MVHLNGNGCLNVKNKQAQKVTLISGTHVIIPLHISPNKGTGLHCLSSGRVIEKTDNTEAMTVTSD